MFSLIQKYLHKYYFLSPAWLDLTRTTVSYHPHASFIRSTQHFYDFQHYDFFLFLCFWFSDSPFTLSLLFSLLCKLWFIAWDIHSAKWLDTQRSGSVGAVRNIFSQRFFFWKSITTFKTVYFFSFRAKTEKKRFYKSPSE